MTSRDPEKLKGQVATAIRLEPCNISKTAGDTI